MNWIFCIPFIIIYAVADPIFSELLYQEIPNYFCSRYYHRSGGIGSRTPLSGVSGVLLFVSDSVHIFALFYLLGTVAGNCTGFEVGFGCVIRKFYRYDVYTPLHILTQGELVTEALSKDKVKGFAVFGMMPSV